jgi:Gpi18-like mannosyltransferase
MRKILLMFIIWMVIVNVFALFAQNRFTLQPDTAYSWINPQEVQQEQTWNIISLHSRWDSIWYLDIAKNGYYLKEIDGLANIVFLPVYPLLIAIGGFILLGHFILAGWILSLVFLFLALLYLYKLTKEFHPTIDPYLPPMLLLVFPTAFFFNAVYTESLFLFLSIAAIYYTKKSKGFMGGVFGFLGSLTRVTGVLLVLPLLIEYIRQRKQLKTPFISWKLLPAISPVFGLALFFLYHAIAFQDPFLFFRVQAVWGRTFALNYNHFQFATHPSLANFSLDALFAIVAIACTILVFKKFGKTYGSYMAATLTVALATGTLMSIGRYILVLFPMFLLIASVSNVYVRYTWILVSILLFAVTTILFVNNYWAG